MSNYYYVDSDLYLKALGDTNLTFKAKGLYMIILGEKHNEIFSEHDFITPIDKYESVQNGLNELLRNNYILKIKGSMHGYVLYENKDKVKTSSTSGYVYVIDNTYGDIKIGMAINLEQRLKEYRTSMPYEPVIIKIIKCNDMRKAEKELHQKFHSKRLSGEWFKLDPEDIEYIKSLKDDELVVN